MSRGWSNIVGILAGGIVAFSILLPLDIGFPRPFIFGRTISWTLIVTVFVVLVFAVLSSGTLRVAFASSYCVAMTAFAMMMLQSALRAPSAYVLTSIQATAAFFCIFVGDYAIFRFAILCRSRRVMARTITTASVAAAGVGIVGALAGATIAPYSGWYFDYFGISPDIAVISRALGTLNQPILFGTAMMLAIPFVIEISSKAIRYAALTIVLLAGVLTASRTILVLAFVFVVGSALVNGARLFIRFAIALLLGLLIVQYVGVPSEWQSDPRVSFLMSRAGIGNDVVARTAVDNLQLRRAAAAMAIDQIAGESTDDVFSFGVGRGYTTAGILGSRINAQLATLDNTFVTLLYEEGLLGLLLFCTAFAVFLYESRAASRTSLHWYAALALLGTGVSFDFEAYTTFNVLAAASMAFASIRIVEPAMSTVKETPDQVLFANDNRTTPRPVR